MTGMTSDPATKAIIADDHPLFRAALSEAVEQSLASPDIVMVGSFEELNETLGEHDDADLLLLDLKMPGCRGYSALVQARGIAPALPVIVVSAFEEGDVAAASIEHGAAGFIPKSAPPETMAEAVRTVLAGGIWQPEQAAQAASDTNDFAAKLELLTPQQQRVLVMLTDGLLNKQIAMDLDISEATVKAHITAILRKLEVQTRTQAVIAARSLEIDWRAYARNDLGAPE